MNTSSLDITASDGKNESSVKVTVNIQDSNTKPAAVNDFGNTNENASVSTNKATGVIDTNDTDPDGDALEILNFQTGAIDNPTLSSCVQEQHWMAPMDN